MKVHVFPNGPMCSIRRALMMWLVPMFLLVALASAVFSYWTYGRMVGAFMDDQMEQLAQSIGAREDIVAPPAVNAERVHKWGAYVTQVYDANGQLLATSWPQLKVSMLYQPGLHDIRFDDAQWRVYVHQHPGGRTVQVLQSGKFRAQIAAERAGSAIAPVLILLPLSILVLWSVARAVSLAVRDIGKQAETQEFHSIKELSLDRVPYEIKPLVVSFNGLLTRLRDSFEAKRRFVQDAAHELRTPLTALSLQLENLRRDLPPGSCKESFGQLEHGVQRASRMVDQMMKMTRADQEPAAAEPRASVDLHAQVRESIGALIALADQRSIDLGVSEASPASPVPLKCAPGDLRSVIDNLIENALRYTPEGGVVDVKLLTESGRPALEVVDTGPGIPQDMLPRVFDRFYRVPGTGAPGSGLGLAIAQSAAERCGLRVTLRNRGDRSGLIARVEPA
ncbi:sensor histidine kinase [Ramlibacter albus]|uniref:histidine kinase n=1 Tax=Ramlibacter albus TaxID=2079448 RepID=A0A923S0E4_9BURK|nr:ATP-binding protein [Ramlibacter albus]MBC5763264.1 sensor histidine kinase N-terminal domain-containing protein [Ramlibacter albus]